MKGTVLNRDEIRRYQRHFALPSFGRDAQEKLKRAKVLVVGAGGLGSPVLLYLAAAGVGTMGIIDHDVVELSNLQRQVIFTESDLGLSKAKQAAERVKQLNHHIETVVYETQLTNQNALSLIDQFDLIIDATDNFPTRYLINDACVICNKPFVYGSIFRFEGQVAVFNYKGSGNYRDLYPKPPKPESVPNCAEGGVLGVLPGIIGSLQANEAIKILAEIGEPLAGSLLVIDTLTAEQRKIKIPKQENSPVIEHLINYDEFCGIKKEIVNMVKEITVKELKKLMDEEADFQLIDVREPHEFEIANLKGQLIPLGELPKQTDKIAKDKQVVVHCRSGARSAQAIEYLQEQLGLDNLYNLKGGVLAWADEIDPSMQKY